MFGDLRDIIRAIRIFVFRFKANILQSVPIDDNILIVAPHPDDEVFGCAGLIQQTIGCKKTVNVAIMSGGGKSHTSCCDVDDAVLVDARRNLSRNASEILGLPLEYLHFFNYQDGNISFKCNETSRLAELIANVNPNTVFVPHSGEGWNDHVETRSIIMQLLAAKPHIKMYEYCVWFWYYNVWRINWKQARLLRMNNEQYQTKLRTIKGYIEPKAPCGNPWSGVLPRVFIKANSWNKELYFKIK